MKALGVALFVLLMSMPGVTFAQSAAYDSSEEVALSDAQEAFDKLKTLAGSWEGPVTLNPLLPGMTERPITLHVTMRVTSRGNAIVHELQEANTPFDASRHDHPVTMFYVDSDQLNLLHYCDAGNRPRMVGKMSSDGKTLEFDFLDLSGGDQYGHMHHAVFTIIDANHHIEEWTYMLPGDKAIHARAVLERTNAGRDTSDH